jgi:hypothetical protein
MPRANGRDAMGMPELRKIMRDWPAVLCQATNDWAQTFAADIWKQAGNGQWRPTLKQARVMRRMIRELATNGDTIFLIE